MSGIEYWDPECHCLASLSKAGIIPSCNIFTQQINSLLINNFDGFSLEHIKGQNLSTLHMNERGTGSLFTVYKKGGLNFSFYSSWMSVLSPFLWGIFQPGSICWKEYAVQQQRNALNLECWNTKFTLTGVLEVFCLLGLFKGSAGFPGPFNTPQ